jgi:hypothetical protein
MENHNQLIRNRRVDMYFGAIDCGEKLAATRKLGASTPPNGKLVTCSNVIKKEITQPELIPKSNQHGKPVGMQRYTIDRFTVVPHDLEGIV